MSSAPRDGTVILVCELVAEGHGNVMPACYMRAHGEPLMEGFWGGMPTRHVPDHLQAEYPNKERFAVGWRNIALTPLCWQPLPEPDAVLTLRRRQGQLFSRKKKAC